MDDARFDRFARAISGLTSRSSRRGLLGVTATLPVVGGALLAEDAEAKRRQQRDRNDERNEVQDEKKKKKLTLCLNEQTIKVPKKKKRKFLDQGATPGACIPCVPDAKPTTCDGKCGSQINNCKQPVDCGSCDCNPPCGECSACEGSPGTCVPDVLGTACGAGPSCTGGTAQPGEICNGEGVCVTPGQIPCQPYRCNGDACGTTCASDADCDPVAFCNETTATCTYKLPPGQTCQNDDECISGACCSNVCQLCCDSADCSGATPVCVSNVCQPCTLGPEACPTDTCCNTTTQACVANCPGDDICGANNTCAPPCEGHDDCGGNELCVGGICRACDVTSGGDLQAAIDASAPGGTLHVCPGSYTEGFYTITQAIIIIGAGDGAGETAILGPVFVEDAGTQQEPVILRDVRILPSGFGIKQTGGNLRMERCTVRGGASQGIGIDNVGGVLEMRRCNILDIITSADVGGLRNTNGSVILRNCRIEGNTAARGAGIFTGNSPELSSSLELHNTEVRGNTANAGIDPRGAGIWNFNGTTTVTISNDSYICDNDPLVSQCDGLTDTSRCFGVCPT